MNRRIRAIHTWSLALVLALAVALQSIHEFKLNDWIAIALIITQGGLVFYYDKRYRRNKNY